MQVWGYNSRGGHVEYGPAEQSNEVALKNVALILMAGLRSSLPQYR
jgi:hypothetical protein